MNVTVRGVLALVFSAWLAGCASGSGLGSVYRAELGTATEPDARLIVERIYHHHQYEVVRLDDPPNFRFESNWRTRDPFDDERAIGVLEAESRLIVTGRHRLETMGGSEFAMHIMVENRVRRNLTGEWEESIYTDGFRSYAREIGDQLTEEFRVIGVRRMRF